MRLSLVLTALLSAGVAVGCGDDETLLVPTDASTSDTASGADAGMTADTSSPDAAAADAGGTEDVAEADIEADADPAPAPNLELIYDEIFAVSCSGAGCHTDGGNAANINLDFDAGLRDRLLAPSSVAGVPHITPGDPSLSYLYLKITGEQFDVGGGGSRMPLARSPVSDELTATLAAWITAGAPE